MSIIKIVFLSEVIMRKKKSFVMVDLLIGIDIFYILGVIAFLILNR
jgi:hypothetical protein